MTLAPSVLAAVVDDGPGSDARLRLYHEQYWSRFFITFQRIYKRFAPLLGFWEFNALVTQHLVANPPVSFDLGESANGFFGRCEATLARADTAQRHSAAKRLLQQALNVDEAERRAFGATVTPGGGPDEVGRALMPGARARQATGVSLLRLDWNLVDGPPEGAQRYDPALLSRPEHWVVAPGVAGVEFRRVDAMTARLLARSRMGSVAAAIAHVVDACDGIEHQAAAALIPELLGRIVAAGWWAGIDLDPGEAPAD